MLNKVAQVDKELEAEYNTNNYGDRPMPGDEMRKLKGLYKKIVEKEKKDEFRSKLLKRESEEEKSKAEVTPKPKVERPVIVTREEEEGMERIHGYTYG